jgi:hypothetical protein
VHANKHVTVHANRSQAIVGSVQTPPCWKNGGVQYNTRDTNVFSSNTRLHLSSLPHEAPFLHPPRASASIFVQRWIALGLLTSQKWAAQTCTNATSHSGAHSSLVGGTPTRPERELLPVWLLLPSPAPPTLSLTGLGAALGPAGWRTPRSAPPEARTQLHFPLHRTISNLHSANAKGSFGIERGAAAASRGCQRLHRVPY